MKTWFMSAYIILFAGASILISVIPCLLTALVLVVNDLIRRKK